MNSILHSNFQCLNFIVILKFTLKLKLLKYCFAYNNNIANNIDEAYGEKNYVRLVVPNDMTININNNAIEH